jgi:hypothetical protein
MTSPLFMTHVLACAAWPEASRLRRNARPQGDCRAPDRERP